MDRYVGHFLELCFCLHTLSMCECVHECMSVSMYVLCMCMYEVSVTLTLSHLKRTLNHLFRYYLLFVFMFFFLVKKENYTQQAADVSPLWWLCLKIFLPSAGRAGAVVFSL